MVILFSVHVYFHKNQNVKPLIDVVMKKLSVKKKKELINTMMLLPQKACTVLLLKVCQTALSRLPLFLTKVSLCGEYPLPAAGGMVGSSY